jgi:hypothetical protein
MVFGEEVFVRKSFRFSVFGWEWLSVRFFLAKKPFSGQFSVTRGVR